MLDFYLFPIHHVLCSFEIAWILIENTPNWKNCVDDAEDDILLRNNDKTIFN